MYQCSSSASLDASYQNTTLDATMNPLCTSSGSKIAIQTNGCLVQNEVVSLEEEESAVFEVTQFVSKVLDVSSQWSNCADCIQWGNTACKSASFPWVTDGNPIDDCSIFSAQQAIGENDAYPR